MARRPSLPRRRRGDEVDGASGRVDESRELRPKTHFADRRLDPDRQSGLVGDPLGEVEERVRSVELGVGGRVRTVESRSLGTPRIATISSVSF